jgi:hypothetical protein
MNAQESRIPIRTEIMSQGVWTEQNDKELELGVSMFTDQ